MIDDSGFIDALYQGIKSASRRGSATRAANIKREPFVILYMLRRLLQLVPVFLCASFLIFSIIHLLPGDPGPSHARGGAL